MLGNLGLIVADGVDRILTIDIVRPVGEQESAHEHRQKQGRDEIPGLVVQLAEKRDFRHEALVVGLVNQAGKEHQKARHQQKHRQQTKEDGFDENDAHVIAQAELHKGQGQKTGHGGQAGGRDLGNRLAEGGDGGLPGGLRLPFLLVSVAEDDGIVDGQSELQHNSNGVGDKGDLAEPVVGAHIQQGRRPEGQQQHWNLRIGAGGQQQHKDDDEHGNAVHHQHF